MNRIRLAHLLNQPAFCCPLSGILLADPVILASSGLSYDRTTITRHVELHGSDPETGAQLSPRGRRLIPNPYLQDLVMRVVQSVAIPPQGNPAETEGPMDEPVTE